MPRGVPKINAPLTAPEEVVLGVVDPTLTDPEPMSPKPSVSTVDGVTLVVSDPPPPWEVPGNTRYSATDARKFVEVPDEWELRWINPRILDQFGWRYWQPVMASDPRVNVKVRSMVSPGNNIRRGGETGDILAWMYRSWVESRAREKAKASAQLKQSSVDKTEQLRDEFARGTYGPNIKIDSAKHPTHTIGEGRSMKDN